jgi:DUF2937 family protein
MLFTNSLKSLLDKLLFACLLLLGIQVPNFMIQYKQFITAHYQEARQQLNQYQIIADRYYAGDIAELLQAHRENPVVAIRAEADIIESLIQRSNYLYREISALENRTVSEQLLHLVRNFDTEISSEVLIHYSVTLPLNTEAIIVGLTLAFMISIALQLILTILMLLLRPKRQNSLFYRS